MVCISSDLENKKRRKKENHMKALRAAEHCWEKTHRRFLVYWSRCRNLNKSLNLFTVKMNLAACKTACILVCFLYASPPSLQHTTFTSIMFYSVLLRTPNMWSSFLNRGWGGIKKLQDWIRVLTLHSFEQSTCAKYAFVLIESSLLIQNKWMSLYQLSQPNIRHKKHMN